jgi:cell wall-associated NlpC family hydrolase
LKDFKKYLFLSVCVAMVGVIFTTNSSAQERDRVIKSTSSQPINAPIAAPPRATEVVKTSSSRPTLTNSIEVVKPRVDAAYEPVTNNATANSAMLSVASMVAAGKSRYSASTSALLDQGIRSRYGLRYKYGSEGPYTYDCSAFVWAAFGDAGMKFTRTSARGMWAMSEPVYGDERFKFGTLVFLNGFGHMGIVADENGFYHASSSKGITYSPFKGYWANRIVGFGKLKMAEAAK